MTDMVDRAQELEEIDRTGRLDLHQRRPVETPLYIDGVRCCVACDEPIPAARLAVAPRAVRCHPCQAAEERRDRKPVSRETVHTFIR